MYEVLKAGGLTVGFNFDAKNRRFSNTYEDMFHAYILGILGLIKAAELIEDGELDAFARRIFIRIYGIHSEDFVVDMKRMAVIR